MKKLVNIINIPQTNQCLSLQTDYKIQRKNLKRYFQSLKLFKIRIFQNVTQIQNISKSFFMMYQNQNKSKKKFSQIQYFMYNGIKVFGNLVSLFGKNVQFYDSLRKRILEIEKKIIKCLAEHKKKYQKLRQLHEKQVKQYATQCFPQTNSILFTIGLVSTQKILKKSDSYRQASLIQQSKRYSSFLNNCLNQMQQLKQATLIIGQDFYSGAKDMWIDQIQKLKQKLLQFQVDQEQINKIADETGRVLTDRSIKSNQNQQQNQYYQGQALKSKFIENEQIHNNYQA